MTYAEVFEFFKNKRDAECNNTNELISNGFHQSYNTDGYLKISKACNLKTFPSQWWHLMNYCLLYYEKKHEHYKFNENVSCGELIFWMAEVSNALSKDDLKALKEEIIGKHLTDRAAGNKLIKDTC